MRGDHWDEVGQGAERLRVLGYWLLVTGNEGRTWGEDRV